MIKLANEYNAKAGEENLLHVAAMKNDIKTVKFLLKNNVDVNEADKNGVTALYIAADKNHIDLARFLVNAGADACIKAADGRNALQVANDRNHAMVAYIIKGKFAADINNRKINKLKNN